MKLQKLRSVWFTMESDPDKSKFEIKHLLSGEIARIAEATHKQRFEFRKDEGTGEMNPVPILEISKLNETELTIIEAVAGWEKIFDENGDPMECTVKNKKRFCRELSEQDFSVFSRFIEDSRKSLTGLVRDEAEDTEKN